MQHAQVIVALLTALTPTVAVFLATRVQRQDVCDLRTEMTSCKNQINADMLSLRKGMTGEMVTLRNQVHADLLMIYERIAKVESKQE